MDSESVTKASPERRAPTSLGDGVPGPSTDADRAAGHAPEGGHLEPATAGSGIPMWTEEERRSFLIGLHIVNLPGEESVLHFLCDAIKVAPLPAPWIMVRDSECRIFFANQSTEATSWNHPLEQAVRELAGAFRVCQTLAPTRRKSCIETLHKTWDQEARSEFTKWYSVKHESGRAYYCNRETGETMWEHPSEVVLPAHYLKIKAIDWLLDEEYFATVSPHPPPQSSAGAVEAAMLSPQSQQSGMDSICEELQEQLRQTISVQRSLQEELSSAELELRSEKAAHSETKQRASKAEAELAEERQHIQQCHAECAELSRERKQALELARSTEQAKDALEARLATMDAGVAKSYLKRLAKQSQVAMDMNASLNSSLRTLDLATESTPSRIPDLTSELEPPSSLPSSRGEAGSLADVHSYNAREGAAHGMLETGGSAGGSRSLEEHRHFEQALVECSELSRSRDVALESAQAALSVKASLEAKLSAMEQALQEKELALAARADDVAGLQAALVREQRSRAELERTSRDAEARRLDLEDKMQQAEVSTKALREQLQKAELGALESQAGVIPAREHEEQLVGKAWKESQEFVSRQRSRHLEAEALRKGEGRRSLPSEGRKQGHRSAPPGSRRHGRGRASGGEGELRGTRHDTGKAPPPLAVRLSLRLDALDWQQLAARPQLLARLRGALRGAIATAAGSKVLPEHVEVSLPESSDACTALVVLPSGASATSVQARLKEPEFFQAVVSSLVGIPELAEVSTGQIGVAEVSTSSLTEPLRKARAGGCSLRDVVASTDGPAHREKQARRARRALEDAIVLASRIQLLRAEGQRTRRRIRTVQERKRALIIASHCAQQFAEPSASRPATAPVPLAHALEAPVELAGANGAAADAEEPLVVLVLHARLAASKRSLQQSNAMLKTSLALTSAAMASKRPSRPHPDAARPATAPPTQELVVDDPHEAAVISAVRARLAASKAEMERLNAALRAEVGEIQRSRTYLDCRDGVSKEGTVPIAT